jgi:branched-chain amino acid transport system substrate-binding protein
MKRGLALGLLAAPALAVPARAADPVEIPVMISLTGPLAFLARDEQRAIRGIEAVVNRTGGIRGRPVKFNISDVQANPALAVQLANQILTPKSSVLIGPESTGAIQALIPLISASSTVMYSLSPSMRPSAGSYVFAPFVGSFELAVAAARFLKSKGWTRIALLNSTDVAGQDGVRQLQAAIGSPEMNGMSIVTEEHFVASDVNVSAQIARMKASNPHVLYIATTGTGFGTTLRGITDNGIDLPVMTNAGNVVTGQMVQYGSFMPKRVYFFSGRYMAQNSAKAGPVRDAQQLYYKTMREQGAEPLDFGANLAWDAVWVVINAYRAIGPDMTGPQLHNYIENLRGFAGTNGMMNFTGGDQRGLTFNSIIIVRWDAETKSWIPQ